ncbi:MAG: outer membrane lipoprotein-sorting protein [Gemmatimonadota bacterium]|jgi:outer membrane lipoprotein-sorting protein
MRTKRAAVVVGGLVLVLGLPGVLAGQAVPDVDRVLDHLDDMYRATSSYSKITMTVVRKRGTRELTLEAWSRGLDDALVVIRAPAREAGTATLLTDEGLWNYAPRADRLIRIPAGLLSESWAGSHFTNDDLLRETKYREDYTASLSWAEEGGVRRLKVTMIPKPDAPVIYSKVEFTLTADDWIPLRVDYYDGGEIVRTMTYSDVQTVSGRKLPMVMTLVPSDAPTERTVLKYDELQLDVAVDGELFTRRGLRRVAKG